MPRNLASIVRLLGLFALAAFAVTVGAQPVPDKVKSDLGGAPLPPGAIARMGTLHWRHGEPVSFVACTPDGKAVLTASRDNTIRLWDRATGKEIRRFVAKAPIQPAVQMPGAMGFFNAGGKDGSRVALSHDGKTIAAIVGNASVQFWDIATGKEIRQLKGPQSVANVVVFAPDGKSIALRGGDRTTHVLETETGKEIRQIKPRPIQGNAQFVLLNGSLPTFDGLAFSPNGKTIATAEVEVNMQKTRKFVKITDLRTGDEVRQIAADNGVASIAYSPDGKTIAFGSGASVHLCEADTGKEIRQFANTNAVASLVFSHDGKTIAVRAANKVVRLFEASTGKKLQEMGIPARSAGIQGNLAFFGDFGGAPEIRDLAFAPNDQTLVAGGAQTVRFWNVATGKEQAAAGGHRSSVASVVLTPDGKTMISHGDDHAIRRWDAHTGQELGQFDEPNGITNVVFAPDGQTIALANTDGTIRLLTPAGKEIHKLKGHANGLASFAFTPNSKMLAARGTADNIIRLFDVAKGHELKQMNVSVEKQPANEGVIVFGGGPAAPGGQGFAFSPDGQTLAAFVGPNNSFQQGQGPTKLAFWDVATGKELRSIPLTTQGVIYNLAYSPDGRLLAAQNANQTVSLWEIASGKERAVLGERQMVQRGGGGLMLAVPGNTFGNRRLARAPLAFSPDGTLLAARGSGNAVRVWQIPDLQQIGLFKGHEGAVNAVSFASDGKSLASASADTTLLVWDLATLKREPNPANVELDATQIDTLWADLAGNDAVKAGKSIRTLASASKQTLSFLGARLKPAVPVDAKKLAQLITDLDSTNFKTRNVANSELEKLGEQAIPALKEVLASQPTVETRRRVEPLIEKVTTGVMSSEQVRLVRAVEVLERLGTSESRQILERLAQGAPGALPSRQAKAVLDRQPK